VVNCLCHKLNNTNRPRGRGGLSDKDNNFCGFLLSHFFTSTLCSNLFQMFKLFIRIFSYIIQNTLVKIKTYIQNLTSASTKKILCKYENSSTVWNLIKYNLVCHHKTVHFLIFNHTENNKYQQFKY